MIDILKIEPYDHKKYHDNFGSKPNPFRYIAIAKANLKNGTAIDLVLKFEKYPSQAQVIKKGMKLLDETGLIN